MKRLLKRLFVRFLRVRADYLQYQVRRGIDQIDDIQYANIRRDRATLALMARADEIEKSFRETRPTTRRYVPGQWPD